jgi:hypothetical protein
VAIVSVAHMMTTVTVDDRLEPDLTPEALADVLVRSTLAERRPVAEPRASRRCSGTPIRS